MACATLKRAYDWDPLNSPNQSTTGPGVSQSSASKPTGSTMLHHHNHHHSLPNTHNFTTSSLPSTHSHAHHRPSKRRCLFVQHHHNQHVRPNPPKEPSPFSFVHARFSADDIAVTIKQEMQRLHNRKQLYFDSNTLAPTTNVPSSSGQSVSLDAPSTSEFGTSANVGLLSPGRRDQPLFTFRQVNLICERLLKERENMLRDEYDQVLTSKLAEQYDTFVKFTYDQIQKRFDTGGTPSYLS